MEDEKFAEQVSELILFATTADPVEGEDGPISAGERSYTTIASYQATGRPAVEANSLLHR